MPAEIGPTVATHAEALHWSVELGREQVGGYLLELDVRQNGEVTHRTRIADSAPVCSLNGWPQPCNLFGNPRFWERRQGVTRGENSSNQVRRIPLLRQCSRRGK